MERSKIPMLSRFDAISHIMPFYGQTHRAFLLLSGLCSETRDKLDEFYDEFLVLMKEFWKCLVVNSNENLDNLFVPNDLFEVSISCNSEESIQAFISFCENINESKGWYFNNHWMNLQVKIRDPVIIQLKLTTKLLTFVDTLKSIQVILGKMDTFKSKIQYESGTLDTNCN